MGMDESLLTGESVLTGAQSPAPGSGGPFPGFGSTPPAVAPAGSGGAAGVASRSDHTHAGVHSVNGVLGDLTVPIFTNGITTGAVQLSTLASGVLGAGAEAWVATVGAKFVLQQSALTVDNITVIAASGKGGFQWVRLSQRNLVWEAQASWAINTSTGSDEGDGSGGAPLKTVSELARRLSYATLRAAVTATVIGNMASTDTATFTFYTAAGGSFSLVGTPTVLYTGTLSGVGAAGAAPSTGDNTISDAAITGGSFTAAGAMAVGVMFSRTSGTACSWFMVKDKGGTTGRISYPMSSIVTPQTIIIGDSYNFAQLPTLIMPKFPNVAFGGGANTGGGVTIKNWLSTGTLRPPEPCFTFWNCWLTSGKFAGGVFIGQCMLTSLTEFAGSSINFNTGPSTMCGGAIGTTAVGSSSLTVLDCCYAQFAGPNPNPPVTCQGAQIQVSSGAYLEQNGPDVLAYDNTGYQFLIDYSARYLQKHSGAFGGSGNAGLCNVAHGSWFMHATTPYWLAGSSTDAVTPILQNGSTGISVATETAGGGVPNAGQNGVFPTS